MKNFSFLAIFSQKKGVLLKKSAKRLKTHEFYIERIIASPNSEAFSNLAPSIKRLKS